MLLKFAANDSEKLIRVMYAIEYGVGIFFTSFNVAHWIFAMKYWSLSLRLQHIVNKTDPAE